MLVVKPNLRRMRAFVESPAERGNIPMRPRAATRWPRDTRRPWGRLLFAAGAVGAVAIVVIALAH